MSGQWQICTDDFNSCWYCGQQILTLFLWTPRISQLSQVKNPEVVQYYKSAVEKLSEKNPEFDRIQTSDVPHIIGPFTNWKYVQMREIVPFCQAQDKNPPNFLKQAI